LGPSAELVVGRDLVIPLDLPRQVIDGTEQILAPLRLLRRLRRAAADVLHAEAWGIRVAGLE
jgi:hypothetical protein